MIVILLSTYNGARYLPQQLESFEKQSVQNWHIVWRDDGSTDNTAAIMNEFGSRTSRCTEVSENKERLGPTNSFLFLLKKVSSWISTDDIIMFSDQDDVWFSDKLERAQNALRKLPNNGLKLYFSNKKLVDFELNELRKSTKINFVPGFPDCLAQNVASGCTIALNSEAAALIGRNSYPESTYHDWWAYILISACGGEIIYDDAQTMLYRQHTNNAVGEQKSLLKRFSAALRRGPSRYVSLFRSHIRGLISENIPLDKDSKKIVQNIEAINKKIELIYILIKYKIKRQGKLETAFFYMWFFWGW